MSIKSSIKSKAVIIGCDDRQFWLFNWWYNNYRRFNNNLVVFVDFGLSERNLRIVRDAGIFEFITIKPELTMRGAKIWFYKPQAMLMSSCDYNLWLDLDTEVRGDLSPVLAYLDTHAIAASLDHFNTVNHQPTDHPSVNTGVFAFRKGYKLIKRWDEVCQQELALNTIRGDQEVLHEILMGRTTTEGCAADKGQDTSPSKCSKPSKCSGGWCSALTRLLNSFSRNWRRIEWRSRFRWCLLLVAGRRYGLLIRGILISNARFTLFQLKLFHSRLLRSQLLGNN